MNRADSISTISQEAFRILDEPGAGILVLDRKMQVFWANAFAMNLLCACEEEILGIDARRILDAHLTPLLQERDDAKRLLNAVHSGTETPGLDLSVQDPRGEERRIVYSSRKVERGTFAGMWVLCMRDVTDQRPANEGLLSSNRQLLVLNQIMGVSASSLSLDELLEASLSKTLELLGFDLGLTYLLNPERTMALTRYHRGVPESYLARSRAIKVHHWPWNFVFVAGQPRYLEVQGEGGTIEEEILASLGVSSLACIPILAESVVVGALFLGSRKVEGFRDEERRLLGAIGQEIGSGVLRSMLHKRLEAAHRETNLYLDVMTHDIKNAENVANLYCDLLLDVLEDDAARYARKLKECVRKSTGILQNVSTIRRIHQEPPDLKPIHLGRVIRAGIERTPETTISFDGTTAEVWADDLLPEVFSNLIGNAVKFGGPDVRIGIQVEDSLDEDHAEVVTVEDTGPGIPDAMKETLFDRFRQGRNRGYGEGLGLFIVRMLIERYGGRIWVEDRVEGRPDLGASFKFTLREVVHGEDDGYEG
ncbi:GAF domain-containing protein [Methanoculleus sp. FWC-SCC3]|uniref:histidine kinase n=1 Tax=Methanoculleus methanifontis TaxID=2584086 RepID=A0ABT8M4I0_9EURY|nr:sensor histidine kinase [Methanoculleus sp. FWC-SCC3]MDN7013511.1 GAF domain-containing protein [Methanoculleus sp. FWC-SCC3]